MVLEEISLYFEKLGGGGPKTRNYEMLTKANFAKTRRKFHESPKIQIIPNTIIIFGKIWVFVFLGQGFEFSGLLFS